MSSQLWEQRTHTQTVEVRSNGNNALVATGYASVFDKRSVNLGGFVEVVAPTAFNKTIQEADVRALFNHDPNKLLGRSSAGTLRMSVDSVGLAYEIDLPDTTDGRDVATLMERGDITGSSFGFRMIEDSWSETEDGFPQRTLLSVALRDVSPVTYPAYPDSEAALRHLAESRSLDFNLVKAAAETNDLRSLLHKEEEKETAPPVNTEQPEKDDRDTPIVRRHQRRFIHL
jgi:HK97 family phage prohead protease